MSNKEKLIDDFKKIAIELSKEYKNNIKIEINTNVKYDSVKVNITEFNR